MLTCSLVLLALFASAQGRAVNISNTWVLPEEGFPVFYRYFRDRISWYEADAVCQFHHANLVTVDTTAQYDAVRAYLKELDISSAVWVGLIRSNPDGDFTWTDYRGMSGDGYWSAAPDARAAPLCAAADPAADYRWEARACGGPTVASFICELPVPQWALGNEGCMVRALPALTILYLPESAAVQLTADCGLAGVKRVQCTGNVKRDSLLKDLSCHEEEESSSTSNPIVGSSTWSLSELSVNATDWETSETPEEDTTAQHETEITHSTPSSTTVKEKQPAKPINVNNKLNNIYAQKNINLDVLHNNNLQSNDIPKLAHNENFLSLEQSEKLEDEKHMHHKMLHDELAKHANYETIFTQPTDHFVPPLVMAKAKISDDMTVLSLAEKHAQQLAEQGFSKHNVLDEHLHADNFKSISSTTTEEPRKTEIIDKTLVMSLQPVNSKDNSKKDKVKSLPKKYIEKYEDPKGRISKIDGKLLKFDKSTEKYSTTMDVTTKVTDITSLETTEMNKLKLQDDSIELTVLLKEPKKTNVQKMQEQNNDLKPTKAQRHKTVTIPIDVVSGVNYIQKTTPHMSTEEEPSSATTNRPFEHESVKTTQGPFKSGTEANQDVYLNHEVIKITIVNDENKVNPTETVFEVTTLVPEFKDTVQNSNKLNHSTTKLQSVEITEETTPINPNISVNGEVTQGEIITTGAAEPFITSNTFNTTTESITFKDNETNTSELPPTTKAVNNTETTFTTHIYEMRVSDHHISPTSTSEPYTTMKEKTDNFNISDIFEENDRNVTDPEAIDDFNSPLLSAANEPLHRPNRSRRPQQPTRLNKFNPFRILG